jgi:hypothetical protein
MVYWLKMSQSQKNRNPFESEYIIKKGMQGKEVAQILFHVVTVCSKYGHFQR